MLRSHTSKSSLPFLALFSYCRLDKQQRLASRGPLSSSPRPPPLGTFIVYKTSVGCAGFCAAFRDQSSQLPPEQTTHCKFKMFHPKHFSWSAILTSQKRRNLLCPQFFGYCGSVSSIEMASGRFFKYLPVLPPPCQVLEIIFEILTIIKFFSPKSCTVFQI